MTQIAEKSQVQLKCAWENPNKAGDIMPEGTRLNMASETMEDMVGKGLAVYVSNDNLAELDSLREKRANQLSEQAEEVRKMAERQLDAQAKQENVSKSDIMEMFAGLKEKSENAKKGHFKSLGENIQTAYALRGVKFRGCEDHIGAWKTEKRFESYRKITGQSESVDADGGFLVDDEFDEQLVTRMVETAILYRACKLRIISQNARNGQKFNSRVDYNRVAGNHPGRAFRTGEGVQKSQHKWTVEQLEMKLLKLASLNVLTDELIEDVAQLTAEVSEWFINDFGFKNDSEIFNGNGTTEMQGILDPATAARIDVARESAGDITLNDVINMWTCLWSRSLPNARWYVNPKVFINLIKMTVGNQPIFIPPATGIAGQQWGSLFGTPLIPIEQASAVGTLGDINLWDLSQYRVIQKGGIKIDTSNEVLFEEDETMLRFVMRNNGLPEWTQQMTGANGVDFFSPFLSLATFV